MPFLRFSRDARGYENTYVLHGFRGGEHAGPRLLYWFRTPPNVRVGRLPLDETAIRAIEESNPELTFDWTKMLKVRAKAPPAPAAARSSPRRAGRGRAAGRPAPAPPAPGAAEEAEAAASRTTVAASGESDVEAAYAAANDGVADGDPVSEDVVEDGGEDAAAGPGPGAAADLGAPHPVAALVGDDGLARLRARYAELRARVAEKQATPRQREALEARVEALNPDAWRAGEPVVRAIERFEADVEEVRKTLGRRSRRRRRRRGDASRTASTALEGSHEGSEGG